MSAPTVPITSVEKLSMRQDSVAEAVHPDSPKGQDARSLNTISYEHTHVLGATSRDHSDTFKLFDHEFSASSATSRLGTLRRSRSLGLHSDNITASSREGFRQPLPHYRSIEAKHTQINEETDSPGLKSSQAAWTSSHKILGQSKKPKDQNSASKSIQANIDTDWPALNSANRSLGHTRHLTDPFVDSSDASPVPSLDTLRFGPVITVTPPVPSSAPPFSNQPSADETANIIPSYTSREAWVATQAKRIVTLCQQTTATLQAYRTTQSPSDFAAWKTATEAFTSAIDLERLQQDRRNMCLAPLGMNAMRTRVVEDTFGRWYDPDKIASGEESLLGYQMAIMERVCAMVRKRDVTPCEEGLRSNARSWDVLSPREAERRVMILRVEEATQRRILCQLTRDDDESEDASTENIGDLSPAEKKALRRSIVGYVKESTQRRESAEF